MRASTHGGEEETVIHEVHLDAHVADCYVCNAETPAHWGIPAYEGYVLPNDWPGEWGGFDVCAACWERQQTLTTPMLVSKFRALIQGRGR